MNRKRSLILFGIVLTLLVSVGIANAQGPTGTRQPRAPRANAGTAFTYQGQLKNSGAAVNGTCNFQFGLWDSAVLGSQVGTTVTVPSVSVTNGLFTTPIDVGANAFTGDARYLGIAVACPSGSYTTFGSRQALTPAPMALALPGLYTQQTYGSPNVIGGYSGNVILSNVQAATIGGGGASGNFNRVTDDYGVVGGGYNNQAGDNAGTVSDRSWTTVSGGAYNTASGDSSVVAGGSHNTADGHLAVVSGGYFNNADGSGAFVGGGGYDGTNTGGNQAHGNASTIGGGLANSTLVTSTYAVVGGGAYNTASGDSSVVAGGSQNNASGNFATVGGGYSNIASGYGSFVGGGGGDGSNVFPNLARAPASVVGGGISNTVRSGAYYAVINGGTGNTAIDAYAFIGGGFFNTASGASAVIGGGGVSRTFLGSLFYAPNSAAGNASTIGGGFGNSANGGYATIPGGRYNSAQGFDTLAAGHKAKANNDGTFVWADSTDADFASTANDQFLIRANGGVGIVDNAPSMMPAAQMHVLSVGSSSKPQLLLQDSTGDYARLRFAKSGVTDVWDITAKSAAPAALYFYHTIGGNIMTLSPGATHITMSDGATESGGNWNNFSDRNGKENYGTVSSRDILARVAALPVTTWNYKTEGAAVRHIGPVAQDFYAAFYVGADDTHISTVDEGGVALAAIQGLYQMNQEQATKIALLEKENAALKQQNTSFESRLAAVEQTVQANNVDAHSDGTGNIAMIVIGGLLGIVVVQQPWRRGER